MKWMFVAVVFLTACGAPKEEEHSIDEEACEHFEQGPSSAVTATAATSGAPSVSEGHQRYDVTLVDVTGGKGGSVTYASAEEADHVLFLSEDVAVKVKDSAGVDVAIESSATSSADCAAVKGRHVVPLKVGTHTLTFGPTDKTSLKLVVEHLDEGDGHDH